MVENVQAVEPPIVMAVPMAPVPKDEMARVARLEAELAGAKASLATKAAAAPSNGPNLRDMVNRVAPVAATPAGDVLAAIRSGETVNMNAAMMYGRSLSKEQLASASASVSGCYAVRCQLCCVGGGGCPCGCARLVPERRGMQEARGSCFLLPQPFFWQPWPFSLVIEGHDKRGHTKPFYEMMMVDAVRPAFVCYYTGLEGLDECHAPCLCLSFTPF